MINAKYPTSIAKPASSKSIVLLDNNPARVQAMFYNNSDEALFINLIEPADKEKWVVRVRPNSYYELRQGDSIFTGVVHGVWNGKKPKGSCHVTELT